MTTKPRERLTAKQEAFCQNYIVLRNATQSAIKAGYSPHLIDTNSNHLLENTSIKARLAELKANLPKDPDIADAEERKRLLTEIARNRIEAPVTAGHKTTAIDILNKLDRLYVNDQPLGNQDNRVVNFVFILPDGTKVSPKALIEGMNGSSH